jgi:hypothetical protein
MKTAPAPFLHFSGYPLPSAASSDDKEAGLPGKTGEQKQLVTESTIHTKLDVPENWDESWFANYE